VSLKALADRVLSRDKPRDDAGTSAENLVPNAVPAPIAPGTVLGQTSPAAPVWSAEDWRDYYLERAAIREFDGCYPRELADRLAWRETANRWWHEHGSRVAAPVCAGCGVIIASADSVPLPHGQRVHDADCMVLFGRRWLAEAAAALEGMGIPSPREYLPDEGAP
jgi:hypothetical protein